jgi:hypothetical protein
MLMQKLRNFAELGELEEPLLVSNPMDDISKKLES